LIKDFGFEIDLKIADFVVSEGNRVAQR